MFLELLTTRERPGTYKGHYCEHDNMARKLKCGGSPGSYSAW